VLAIIITIMVLELPVPHDAGWQALRPVLPVFGSYALSFVFLGIYWSNHHHLLHACHRVTGAVLWANLHLLFWLSLVPFVTAWMGENHFESLPTAIAYTILQHTLVAVQGPDSVLARAVRRTLKERLSLAAYAAAIPLAFVNEWIADALYAGVALTWLVPDRRIETEIGR
jgi:uncharacterized membrane protein